MGKEEPLKIDNMPTAEKPRFGNRLSTEINYSCFYRFFNLLSKKQPFVKGRNILLTQLFVPAGRETHVLPSRNLTRTLSFQLQKQKKRFNKIRNHLMLYFVIALFLCQDLFQGQLRFLQAQMYNLFSVHFSLASNKTFTSDFISGVLLKNASPSDLWLTFVTDQTFESCKRQGKLCHWWINSKVLFSLVLLKSLPKEFRGRKSWQWYNLTVFHICVAHFEIQTMQALNGRCSTMPSNHSSVYEVCILPYCNFMLGKYQLNNLGPNLVFYSKVSLDEKTSIYSWTTEKDKKKSHCDQSRGQTMNLPVATIYIASSTTIFIHLEPATATIYLHVISDRIWKYHDTALSFL